MNALKYLSNKTVCPYCKEDLTKDEYEVYCSHCGLVLFDFTPPTPSELNFIIDLITDIPQEL